MALILKIMHLRESFMEIHSMTSPSTTQQNLNCFQTEIFEYYVSEYIPNLMKRPLTSKIMHLIENCLGRRVLI